MKKLRKDIKQILKNDCLNNTEKNHLKSVFKLFIQNRDILSRPSIDFSPEEDCCYGLEDILNNQSEFNI